MRAVFYTREQIEEAFYTSAPELRRFAADCRSRNPVPDRSSLPSPDREQLRILSLLLGNLHLTLKQLRRRTPKELRWVYVDVLHGSPLTLLAASEVFGPEANSMVLLLSQDWKEWVRRYRGADGWYRSNWVTIHEEVPQCFADHVAQNYPAPYGFSYWVATIARGGGASHDLWKWDGTKAVRIETFCQEANEEGFIDDLTDLSPN
jgi:hypothetical protein